MADASLGQIIGPAVALMGAAVVAVPLFMRLGHGSVLGYFGAGILVGPSVLGLFSDAQSILHFSELGVVMFLFVIGLELRPYKLWAMRGQIFGLGLVQVAAAIAALRWWGEWPSVCLLPSPLSPGRASFCRRPPSSCRSFRTAANCRIRRGKSLSPFSCSRI